MNAGGVLGFGGVARAGDFLLTQLCSMAGGVGLNSSRTQGCHQPFSGEKKPLNSSEDSSRC